MRNPWSKVSLFKFQQVDAIQAKELPDIDRVLFSICAVFDMTEYELNNGGVKKADKLIKKIEHVFKADFKKVQAPRIGKYFLNYDVGSMTFGQYIELSFYLSMNPIQNAHNVLASISNTWLRKNNSATHGKRAEYFLRAPVPKVLGSLNGLMAAYTQFNGRYKALFGLDTAVAGESAPADPFNKRYGWIYSASQVAEYERITLEQAYGLPVKQALHDLTYLKAKGKYEAEQLKRK